MKSPFDEGDSAGYCDLGRDNNPYPRGTDEALKWDRGYFAGMACVAGSATSPRILSSRAA